MSFEKVAEGALGLGLLATTEFDGPIGLLGILLIADSFGLKL